MERAEHVDPFDEGDLHLWIKLEHLGRYLYAADQLASAPPGRHLDLGCATGYGLVELLPHVSHCIGLDYSSSLVEIAASHYPDIRVVRSDLDVDDLADVLPGPPLDSVTAFECFEHLHDPLRTLRQLRGRVRYGALLLASVPQARYEVGIADDPHHHHRFEAGAFAAMLAVAGFQVEQMLGQGSVHRVNRRETSLVRQQRFDVRPSALGALHRPEMVRQLALLLAYPDTHDIEFSYSHLFVARAT